MADEIKSPQNDAAISAEALRRAEQFIEEEEGALNRYRGALAVFVC
jgi:hypothetical protein